MENRENIKCPFCNHWMSEDIYAFTDSGDMDGSFNLECEACSRDFIVEFNFEPYIKELIV